MSRRRSSGGSFFEEVVGKPVHTAQEQCQQQEGSQVLQNAANAAHKCAVIVCLPWLWMPHGRHQVPTPPPPP